MEESILTSIKKLLGMTEDYTAFDQDIIIHINTVFTTLYEIGVGPKNIFSITDASSKWGDFIDDERLNAVKTYIYLKVKLVFDPPSSSFVLSAYKDLAAEYEWRLNVMVDKKMMD